MNLEVHPEVLGHSKVARQAKSSVCRDSSLPVHNLVDSPRGNTDILRQPVLTQFHRLQKFFEQNFSGVDWSVCFSGHRIVLLVIIGDLNVVSVSPLPSEADPPLIIDPDAVLPGTISAEPFKVIAGRNSQIV